MTSPLVTPPAGVRLTSPKPPITRAVEITDQATPRFHADGCAVCNPTAVPADSATAYVDLVAGAAADEVPSPQAALLDPTLTPGQRRVLDAERPRLVRLLDRRTPQTDAAVLVLLADLAGQAPALDHALASDDARRRELDARRPRPAQLLTRRAS